MCRKYIHTNELKKIQLDILKEVADYCQENNICYFLGYGSLLGAIRHNGYIPWDDDIDIMMPRPDYDLFIKKFRSSTGNLVVIAPSNNKNYCLPYCKVYDKRTQIHETQFKINEYGVNIDVFPLDGINDDKVLWKITWLTKFMNTKKAVFKSDRTFIKKAIIAIGKLFLYPFSMHSILVKMDKLAKETSYSKAEFITCSLSVTAKREICPKSYVQELIDWEFEQYTFKVPTEYDKYLTCLYGDYKTLPPEEERVAHHVFKAWWKES